MRNVCISVIIVFLWLGQQPVFAHFGMVIPSANVVTATGDRTVRLQLSFSHPFDGLGMDLARPNLVVYGLDGARKDLSRRLKPVTFWKKRAWQADYLMTRPGAHWFVMTPQPYWEMAEDCFIIHYTKTLVVAFGDDEGWGRELGLKTEIVPLSNPASLYQGNVFQGMVKVDGKSVPFARVEIEYFNREGNVRLAAGGFSAQTVKADPNGIFSYSTPAPGWWGFAALNTADYRLKKGKADKQVELGAVIWVQFHKWMAGK